MKFPNGVASARVDIGMKSIGCHSCLLHRSKAECQSMITAVCWTTVTVIISGLMCFSWHSHQIEQRLEKRMAGLWLPSVMWGNCQSHCIWDSQKQSSEMWGSAICVCTGGTASWDNLGYLVDWASEVGHSLMGGVKSSWVQHAYMVLAEFESVHDSWKGEWSACWVCVTTVGTVQK